MRYERGLLDFHGLQLAERLGNMAANRQQAFVASCFERSAPIYLEFATLENLTSGPLIREALDLSWWACLHASSEIKTRLKEIDLGGLASNMPEGYASGLEGYARDALHTFYFAVDFGVTGSSTSASECGRWIFNIVDALVMDGEPSNLISPEVQMRINAHRIMQRELRKQNADLVLLARTDELDQVLLARLRGESRRLGERLLQEAESRVEALRLPNPRAPGS